MTEQERATTILRLMRREAARADGSGTNGFSVSLPTRDAILVAKALEAFANRSAAPADLRAVVAKAVSDEYAMSGLIANYPKSDRVAAAVLSAIRAHGYEVVPVGRNAGSPLTWLRAAMTAIKGVEADTGKALDDDIELGRIFESSLSPSFRIKVGHIRQMYALADGDRLDRAAANGGDA